MPEPKVMGFFYGSYINRSVLAEAGLTLEEYEVARLPGYDLEIAPLANLVRSDRAMVYGILAEFTHRDLALLYEHAKDVLGGVYLPEAVITQTLDGASRPALCYISYDTPRGPADSAYVRRISGPAQEYGMPDWYIERIESWLG